MIDILTNHLYPTGTKFIVTQDVKGNSFTPATTGFIAHMTETDMDYQNVASVKVVLTRRGKGGQNRINIHDMSIPIFTNEEMLKHENYLPIDRRSYSHIESTPFDEPDLLGINPLDFLGWACSYATYLRHLAFNMSYPRGINNKLWPRENNILEKMFSLSHRFEDSPKEFLRSYVEKDFRIAFISKAREAESILTKCSISYKNLVISAILNSAYFLKYTNEEYYKVENEKLVKNTIDFYEKQYKKVKSLTIRPNKSKRGRPVSARPADAERAEAERAEMGEDEAPRPSRYGEVIRELAEEVQMGRGR
jgi:hypothetical protein